MLHLPEGNPVPICCHSPPFPGPHEPPFPSLEEPGLEVSHVWTHTPCGLLCLVPPCALWARGLSLGSHVEAPLQLTAGVCPSRLGPPMRWLPLVPPVFQDSAYLDDLSNASIFSSSVDSLSDIADTPDFLPADSLSQVPTIWDVSTGPAAHEKLLLPTGPWTGLEDPVSSLSSTPLLVSYQSQSQPEEEDEAEEDEGEELGHTETYADYVPSKCECAAHCQPPAGPCQACTAPAGSSWRQGQWPELRAGSWDSATWLWLWAGLGGSSVNPTWLP